MSINRVWHTQRPELLGANFIYGEMAKAAGHSIVSGHTISIADSIDHIGCSEQSQHSGGQYKRAHDWIHEDIIFLMDRFCACTAAFRYLYAKIKGHKTVDTGFDWFLRRANGGSLQGELLGIVDASFYDDPMLCQLKVNVASTKQQQILNDVMDFTFDNLYYRLEATMPEMQAYPCCSVSCLSPELSTRSKASQDMLSHLRVILNIERLAHMHQQLMDIWSCIVWKDNALICLLVHTNELEHAQPHGSATTYILEAIHRHLPYDNAAEDIHQHVRDESRRQRYTMLSALSVAHAAIEPGVADARGCTSCHVTDDEPANTSRYDTTQAAVTHKFRDMPKHWCPKLDFISRSHEKCTSPIAATYFHSAAAWQWLLQWFRHPHWKQAHIPIAAAWRSRLLRNKTVVKHGTAQTFVVLASVAWGAFIWRVQMLREGMYILRRTCLPENMDWRV